MKRILMFVLAFLLLASMSFAATGNTYVTANTISFNTVGKVVTFNTTVNKVLVINDSATDSIHVTFTGLGWNSDRSYYTPPVVQGTSPSTAANITGVMRIAPAASVSMDINTNKIGFIKSTVVGSDSGTTQYVAISDRAQP